MGRILVVVFLVVLVAVAGCGENSTSSDPESDIDHPHNASVEGGTDTGPSAVDGEAGTGPMSSPGATPTPTSSETPTHPPPETPTPPGTPTPTPAKTDPDDGTDPSLVTGGLVLRLEADSGVSTTDGAVTRWADQSGQGNHLTAEGDPVLRRNALNGRDVISFDGEEDLLDRTGELNGLPEDDSDRTMFVVANHDGLGSGGVGYGKERAGGNQAFQFVVDEDGLLEFNAFGKPNDYLVPINASRRGWMTRSVVVRNDTFTHAMNGTRYDTVDHEFNTRPHQIVVGAEIDYEPRVKMDVAAVLVYDRALTAEEHRRVEDYLRKTYLPELAADGNSPPEANDDVATVADGGSVEIDVLANDVDIDGTIDAGSVVVLNRSRGRRGPMYGHVSVNESTGAITYDHAGTCLVSFYRCSPDRSDSFTYTVLDENGKPSNVATVFIEVSDGDDGSD